MAGPTPKRPYLIRAMHEWMCDNDLTPHIVVDADYAGVVAPTEHAKNGKLVLNIGTSATKALAIGNERLTFDARFGGASRRIEIPAAAVLGIYARETGQGMIFADEDPPPDSPEDSRAGQKPALKVVK